MMAVGETWNCVGPSLLNSSFAKATFPPVADAASICHATASRPPAFRCLADRAASSVACRGRRAIVSWAGPWPLNEREWDAVRRRRAFRFQIVDDRDAWLLICEGGRWSAEARYD